MTKQVGEDSLRRTPVSSSLFNIFQVPELEFQVILIHHLTGNLLDGGKNNDSCLAEMQNVGLMSVFFSRKMFIKESNNIKNGGSPV